MTIDYKDMVFSQRQYEKFGFNLGTTNDREGNCTRVVVRRNRYAKLVYTPCNCENYNNALLKYIQE